jgi:hypothetical protein
MGGSAPDYPEMSDEERELYQRQSDYYEQLTGYLGEYYDYLLSQYEDQQQLMDLVLETYGIEKIYDEDGNVTGYQYTEEETAAQQKYRDYLEQYYESEEANMEYQEWQREYTQRQANISSILQEISLYEAGYEFTYDDDGNVTGYQKRELTEEEQEEEELASLKRERELKALKGEADVDPQLEEDLAESEANMRERLRRQLGDDYETSDPGSRALSQFEQDKNQTLWYARHGEMTTAANLNAQARQQSLQEKATNWQAISASGAAPLAAVTAYDARNTSNAAYYSPQAYYANIAAAQQVGYPGYGGFGAGQPNYGSLAGGYERQRQNSYAAAYQQYANRANAYGQLIGSFLGAVGGYFGGSAGAQAGQQSGQSFGYFLA